MNTILKILISAVAVFILAHILPGVEVSSYIIAIIVAITLSLLNTFIKPLLIILTIPITVITLGLFFLVINALVILIADFLISGFAVSNIFWALIFSILLSISQSILYKVLSTDQKKK